MEVGEEGDRTDAARTRGYLDSRDNYPQNSLLEWK